MTMKPRTGALSSSCRRLLWLSSLLFVATAPRCAVVDAQWTRLWEYIPSNSRVASEQAQPLKRAAHSMVVYRDSLYVFGGIGDTNDEEDHEFDDTWKYDIENKKWTNLIGDREGSSSSSASNSSSSSATIPRRVSPPRRFHHSTALHSNATVNEMIIFGGLSISPNTTASGRSGGGAGGAGGGGGGAMAEMVVTQFNDVWRLSLGDDGKEIWQADVANTTATSNGTNGASNSSLVVVTARQAPMPRSEAGAVAHEGQLYVYGGISYDASDSTPVDFGDLWRYNLSDYTWTQVVPADGVAPPNRFSHSFSAFTNAAGETFLVAFSGRHLELPTWTLLGDTWLFSLTTQRWRLVPSTPTVQRAYTTLVTTGGATPRMWFFGGYFRPRQSSSGYVYDDVVGGFFNLDERNTSVLQLQFYHAVFSPEDAVPPLRYNHRAVLWKDTMIVHGGSYQTQRGDLWMFNLTSAALRKDASMVAPVNLETLVYVLAGFVFSIVGVLVVLIVRWRRIDRRNVELARMRGVAAMRGVARERLDQMAITKYKKPVSDTPSSPASTASTAASTPSAIDNNLDDHSNDDVCPICLIEFEEDEDVRNLPCKHLFHVPCIDEWLSRNTTCPMCKNNLELDAVDIAIAPDPSRQQHQHEQQQQSGSTSPTRSPRPASPPSASTSVAAVAQPRGGAIVTPVSTNSGSV